MTEPLAAGRPSGELLAWSRSLVLPALRKAVDQLPPAMRTIAEYHHGWRDEYGNPVLENGGKAIRPALVLLAAEAVGGTAGSAVPAAVAVELIHNFSLLHDDVMDRDTTRRHRATAWTVFGVNAAILAGDALQALALDVLAASGHPRTLEAIRTLNDATVALLEGQAYDLDFETRDDVRVSEVERMSRGKTGALLGASTSLGALYGGGSDEQVEAMRGYGTELGLAFQHVDDLLGIWGDPAVTGKVAQMDLVNRKKSLPVVRALNAGVPASAELASLYFGEHEMNAETLARAADLVDQAGGRAWSQTQADELHTQALVHLGEASPTARAAVELGTLAQLVTHRDH
ncbi:family 2 encapsulin nanocompartment cargo protein polyprenyl transferase [Lentzea sp. HUAS12]|uniref:family 2 encapsulin nanocompartment cargo protein polyprenyl transferase n=1 Tax=Lentzea sp. HUAS12 TaxID=2951806 RepID=UPI00209D998C|nr:family 2 encapsulin nanocompartment cargo protein polyprenyl transferase [Lentzea sp. HUAS12]USX52672.1 polyprenyl synthetase family protein [Lentzea sp. HUAS12]